MLLALLLSASVLAQTPAPPAARAAQALGLGAVTDSAVRGGRGPPPWRCPVRGGAGLRGPR